MAQSSKTHAGEKVLNEKLQGIKVAMLTTIDQHHNILRSRPMITQKEAFDGDLWFLTQINSPMADEAKNRQVNLSYVSHDGKHYVSVSGTAQVVQDQHKAEKLWKDAYSTWFPAGKADPELALLKVTVTSAEYWDNTTNKMVQIFQET